MYVHYGRKINILSFFLSFFLIYKVKNLANIGLIFPLAQMQLKFKICVYKRNFYTLIGKELCKSFLVVGTLVFLSILFSFELLKMTFLPLSKEIVENPINMFSS
jgi:hypothetical protein